MNRKARTENGQTRIGLHSDLPCLDSLGYSFPREFDGLGSEALIISWSNSTFSRTNKIRNIYSTAFRFPVTAGVLYFRETSIFNIDSNISQNSFSLFNICMIDFFAEIDNGFESYMNRVAFRFRRFTSANSMVSNLNCGSQWLSCNYYQISKALTNPQFRNHLRMYIKSRDNYRFIINLSLVDVFFDPFEIYPQFVF